MPKDFQMKIVREQINAVIEQCALAAQSGGADAVRAMKVAESPELPPKPPTRISAEYAALLAQQTAERNRQCDCEGRV